MNPFAAVVLMSFVAAPVPKDAPAKPDAEAVQGEWKVVSFVKNGDDRSASQAGTTLTFKGDALTIREPKREEAATFTLDPKAAPKTIDLKVGGKGEKELMIQGIYKLEGDKLTICFGVGGRDRPKEFKSPADSGVGLFVLERAKK